MLLDGLDEVPEADERRTQIKQAVESFAAAYPKCRILVTSRTYAYQQQEWRLTGFDEATLAPFSKAQIRTFVDRWYAVVGAARGRTLADAQGRSEVLKREILRNQRLLDLARRPLLLALMASLHAARGASLPERREELYSEAVELLLDRWEQGRIVRNPAGQILLIQPSLAEFLAVGKDQIRALLNRLAFDAHSRQPELVGTANIAETELVDGLLGLSGNQRDRFKRLEIIDYLSQRSGLLVPHGVRVYTFPHRTFQEYLAACHLTDDDYPEKVADLARSDPDRWREVTLLAGAKAARAAPDPRFGHWSMPFVTTVRTRKPATERMHGGRFLPPRRWSRAPTWRR